MALWGTIVNALAIIAGSLIGLRIPSLRPGIRATVLQGMGIALLVLGAKMALQTQHVLLLISSLAGGGVLGEWIGVEERLQRLGRWLEAKVGGGGASPVAAGFVTATLVFCVGAMAILGSLDSGIRHNHDILYTKSMLDGFFSIIFASTLGVGVLFSAAPVFLYQGAIAVIAALFVSHIDLAGIAGIIREVSAVGGVLIIGIGMNILEIKTIRVANLLPTVAVAAVAAVLLGV
jgi:hypothetical protein